MTMVDVLRQNPEIPHGPIAIAFTSDEEIGIGINTFDVAGFGASFAYTVDGDTLGEINHETWSARLATITFRGVSTHPGTAKGADGQRGVRARRFPDAPARGHAAGDHRGPRRLHPPVRRRDRRRDLDAQGHPARFRRRRPERARREGAARAAARVGDRGALSRRRHSRRGRRAVPEHERGAEGPSEARRARARGRAPCGTHAAHASRFAAGPTGRS